MTEHWTFTHKGDDAMLLRDGVRTVSLVVIHEDDDDAAYRDEDTKMLVEFMVAAMNVFERERDEILELASRIRHG